MVLCKVDECLNDVDLLLNCKDLCVKNDYCTNCQKGRSYVDETVAQKFPSVLVGIISDYVF